MCGIFVVVPLINERRAGRKIVTEQLASATGKNPSDSCNVKSHSKEWDFAGGGGGMFAIRMRRRIGITF